MMFSHLGHPKLSQNIGIYDVVQQPSDTFATQYARNDVYILKNNMTASSETLVSTVFLKKKHKQNTVNTNEFKYNIFHGKQVKQTNTLIFIPCLGNVFSRNMLCLGNFWLPKLFQKHGNFWSPRRIRSVIFWRYLRCFLQVHL